jgi:hypothetical protein
MHLKLQGHHRIFVVESEIPEGTQRGLGWPWGKRKDGESKAAGGEGARHVLVFAQLWRTKRRGLQKIAKLVEYCF